MPDLADPSAPWIAEVEAYFQERHREVWALAAAGASPEEIARQTGQPIGQVELIIGLYRQFQFVTRRGRPCAIPLRPPSKTSTRPRSTA